MSIENGCSPSTTWVWKKVKIEPAAGPQGTARAKRAPQRPSPEAPTKPKQLPRRAAGVLVQYRAGAEAWWEFSYGGRKVRVPGWWSLHDAMRHLFEGDVAGDMAVAIYPKDRD